MGIFSVRNTHDLRMGPRDPANREFKRTQNTVLEKIVDLRRLLNAKSDDLFQIQELIYFLGRIRHTFNFFSNPHHVTKAALLDKPIGGYRRIFEPLYGLLRYEKFGITILKIDSN